MTLRWHLVRDARSFRLWGHLHGPFVYRLDYAGIPVGQVHIEEFTGPVRMYEAIYRLPTSDGGWCGWCYGGKFTNASFARKLVVRTLVEQLCMGALTRLVRP